MFHTSGRLFLLLVFFAGSLYAEDITLYTYHGIPPFVVGKKKGLSYELAEYLTKKSKNKYRFSVKVLPRRRLDQVVKKGTAPGLVAWVEPTWFKDPDKQKYMWTKNVLMRDGASIISNTKRKLEYAGAKSMSGLVFGGILGHNYKGIDDYVKQGKIKRVDVRLEILNLRKVASGAIDVTLAPRSSSLYYIKKENLKLHISKRPHSEFYRRAFVVNRDRQLLGFLEKVFSNLDSDQGWKKRFQKYMGD